MENGDEKDYRGILQDSVKKLCEKEKITRKELAERSEVSEDTIKSLMSANHSEISKFDLICKLAGGFGITVSEFLNTEKLNEVFMHIPERYQEMYNTVSEENKRYILKYIEYVFKVDQMNK